jgi:hypothetical protein
MDVGIKEEPENFKRLIFKDLKGIGAAGSAAYMEEKPFHGLATLVYGAKI